MPSSPTSLSLSRLPLLSVLNGVPDPRDRRGLRHALPVVLACAVGGVLAGARSWVAVAEWAHDADRDALSRIGIDAAGGVPSESTIRRTLAAVDPAVLDARMSAWAMTRVGELGGRRVVAVDGKTMRGAFNQGRAPHLVAALDHSSGVVLAQTATHDQGGEIAAVRDLLTSMDLTSVVVTADALHCQRETAQVITAGGGDYVLTVKGNQPGLLARLKDLPWGQIPAYTSVDTGHGRRVRRTLKAVEVPAWVDWPAAAQVIQVRRTRTINGRKHVEVVYAISSVPMQHAQPPTMAAWIQGHWHIENRLHWVRDVTFTEDHHRLRTGNGPHIMATLRNTAITLLRLTGTTNIAAGLRHQARNSTRPTDLIATA